MHEAVESQVGDPVISSKIHVAPFLQGFGLHSSFSVKKKILGNMNTQFSINMRFPSLVLKAYGRFCNRSNKRERKQPKYSDKEEYLKDI